MTEKTVNYTPEMTATVVEAFKAGTAVEAIALSVGKSVRSIVAKLSREGVYTAKAKVKAEARVTKAALIAKIAANHSIETEVLASLEKASKEALEALAG